jgi:hypothetical protein
MRSLNHPLTNLRPPFAARFRRMLAAVLRRLAWAIDVEPRRACRPQSLQPIASRAARTVPVDARRFYYVGGFRDPLVPATEFKPPAPPAPPPPVVIGQGDFTRTWPQE